MATNWNLQKLLPNNLKTAEKKMEQDASKEVALFLKKYSKNKSYLKDPKELLTALNAFEHITHTYAGKNKIGYCYGLQSNLDEPNPEYKAKLKKIDDWWLALYNQIQFFEINLSKTEPKYQKIFLQSQLLAPFHHSLQRLFANAKYILTDPEEKILNLTAQSSHSDWVKLVSTLLSKEEANGLPFSQIAANLSSTDKKVRDLAYLDFSGILAKHADVAEAEINAIFGRKKVSDELRGCQRPDEARLISDDMEPAVVDALLSAVSKNFPISQDYYQLKAKLFNKPKLDYQERNVPFGDIPNHFPYEQSLDLVTSVFAKLDPQFAQILETFSNQGQVDVYPKRGKHGGAFCSTQTLETPTYILLNHANKLTDVLTLAHEAGHGINNELMRAVQPERYFNTPLATAEVASTFFEDFVLEDLSKNLTDKQHLAILMAKLNDDISSIFRQIACYQFEQELHLEYRKQGYLSKQEISRIFQKHMSAYMGPFVDQPDSAQYFWVYWGHIRSFFYVYSYASGLLISKSLQRLVRQDKKNIQKVKTFLAAGSSKSPKEIFADLGLDITNPKFWDSGLQEIQDLLTQAQTLAKKLKLTK